MACYLYLGPLEMQLVFFFPILQGFIVFPTHALNCTGQYGQDLYNAMSLLGTSRLFEGIISNHQGKLGTHCEEIIQVEIMQALSAWFRRAGCRRYVVI